MGAKLPIINSSHSPSINKRYFISYHVSIGNYNLSFVGCKGMDSTTKQHLNYLRSISLCKYLRLPEAAAKRVRRTMRWLVFVLTGSKLDEVRWHKKSVSVPDFPGQVLTMPQNFFKWSNFVWKTRTLCSQHVDEAKFKYHEDVIPDLFTATLLEY